MTTDVNTIMGEILSVAVIRRGTLLITPDALRDILSRHIGERIVLCFNDRNAWPALWRYAEECEDRGLAEDIRARLTVIVERETRGQ